MSYSYLEKLADTHTCLRPKNKKKFRIAGSLACRAVLELRWF